MNLRPVSSTSNLLIRSEDKFDGPGPVLYFLSGKVFFTLYVSVTNMILQRAYNDSKRALLGDIDSFFYFFWDKRVGIHA